MEFDEDAPLAQSFKRKRKPTRKKKESDAKPKEPPEAAHDPEPAQLPAAKHLTANSSPEIAVSELDYSIEDHFKAVDTIAKLCGYPDTINANQAEIKRFSNSITFLREWRDLHYAPRIVRFASQHNSKEKDVVGEVTLNQFSAASVPKKDMGNGSEAGAESSKDFVMYVGGAVWALDWCPRVDRNSENHIKSEFVAVAAHPPGSSYHKIGAPLTGRGAIQIWCLLTVYVKEDLPNTGNKKSKPNSQKKVTFKYNNLIKPPRPRGRPRKKPLNDSVEKIDSDDQYVQPLAIEYSMSSARLQSSDGSSANSLEHVYGKDSVSTHKGSSQTEHANLLLLTAPKGRGNKAMAGKEDHVLNNDSYILRQCDHGESALVNPLASASFSSYSLSPDKNITCISSCDANTSKNSIPMNVALPRLMLCLADNGKVAWDVKWRPVNAYDSESMNVMGYLAVLLGNGALEVCEVPLPYAVKLVYPSCQEHIDPRFIKLKPVFRCSKLKCGDRQSIPLTVEWSVSSPHDMILAGCHDGVVALWKFSVTDSLTGSYASFSSETRPLLSFSADTCPIRTLAWAPIESDLESANVFVTAGHKGFKFWDLRDPFHPLRDYPLQGITFGLDWLPDPRCVFGIIDDGTLWLLSLEKAAHDIPVTGKCPTSTPKQGLHSFDCSSFSIWSVQASRLTGMVAYCGEEGTTLCFQPTTRSVKDPSRNRMHHYLCGSLLEEGPTLIVATPSNNSLFPIRIPSMKRCGLAREQENKAKKQMAAICGNDRVEEHGSDNSAVAVKKQASKSKQSSSKSQLKAAQETPSCRSEDVEKPQRGEVGKEERGDEFEVFPPKIVAMHRVRWNVNKGSEKWLCYGGAAGLVRCQEVDFPVFE
ncbi:hypothetical protein DH2020_014183 [Rehmannia glutinosa]|uniref:Transducin/WD40 repeat-like superfamily protein n=1 Tax=Rehmannia glutinosa TaxID=99300 RepID=A0ABR0WX62_REHGL